MCRTRSSVRVVKQCKVHADYDQRTESGQRDHTLESKISVYRYIYKRITVLFI
jgi:hypothetical protein